MVAARLTENEDIKVGVLEAGKSRLGDFLVDSPAMFMQMFMNPEYDWCHMTEPQVSDVAPVVPNVTFNKLSQSTETQQGPSPPHPTRQGSWRIIGHQLHDVGIKSGKKKREQESLGGAPGNSCYTTC